MTHQWQHGPPLNHPRHHLTTGHPEPHNIDSDDILRKWRINRRLEETKTAVRDRTYCYHMSTPLLHHEEGVYAYCVHINVLIY